MSDDTYNTKVFIAQGGEEIVVKDGGKITLRAGATIENDGDVFVSATFDTDYFEVSEGEVTLKTEVAALLALVAAIPTEDPEVEGEIWNDSGTLKASAGA